jgi:HlyD family secretion protein
MLVLTITACATRTESALEATGTIEVDEVDVAAMTPARVTRLWADEGKTVRAGDTLVTLRVTGLARDVETREARLRAAEAQLRDLERGAMPNELARAESELRAAEAEATRAARDLERIVTLARNGTVSQQSLDAARSSASTAVARRDAARDALHLLRDGTRPERIAAARADVAVARAAARAGQETANDLTLTAPTDGVVLTRNVLEGEVLAGGIPALTLGVTARPWVRVYVDERALPRIKVGDSVTATLDAYPGRHFRGRVIALRDRAEFTPRIALTERERAELLFAVKVALADSSGTLKPGLPVTVRLQSRAAP